jgi:hypothetical protein
MKRTKKHAVHCDQCEMLSINGVPCHEHGCSNQGAKWENDTWVRYYQCFICGCDVPVGESCDCTLDTED